MDTTDLRNLISIVDSDDEPLDFDIIERRAPDYRFSVDHDAGEIIRLLVDHAQLAAAPDSVITRASHRPSLDEVGEIAGSIAAPDIDASVLVEVVPDDAPATVGRRTTHLEEDGSFIIEHLPEGTYRIRAFVDRNEDGRWDPGALSPYVPPAPITWLEEPVRVRERWETDLGDTLRFDFQPDPLP